jgi:hypothetical protein
MSTKRGSCCCEVCGSRLKTLGRFILGCHVLVLIPRASCLHDMPLKYSIENRPRTTTHRPPMKVKVQPIPTVCIMSSKNATAMAANEHRTRLVEAFAAEGDRWLISTTSVLKA